MEWPKIGSDIHGLCSLLMLCSGQKDIIYTAHLGMMGAMVGVWRMDLAWCIDLGIHRDGRVVSRDCAGAILVQTFRRWGLLKGAPRTYQYTLDTSANYIEKFQNLI